MVNLCKKCNKKHLAELEEKLIGNNIEYKFCCIKQCGNPLSAKKDGEVISATSIDELIGKIK